MFMQVATSGYQVDAAAWKSAVQITGGTPHTISLRYDSQCERRVAAKIAYGLFRTIADGSLNTELDVEMRRYILGVFD